MKQNKTFFIIAIVLSACTSPKTTQVTSTPTTPLSTAQVATSVPTATTAPAYVTPPNTNWHIQYTGDINTNINVGIYNLDLFETDASVIAQLKERNIFVMCYFSAGSYEDWRPDINQFPASVLGNPMEDWQGETWLDIRQIDLLAPVMEARLNLASSKGCHGVDPDNINGYTNETGFPLTYQDQLAYNIWLAESAHARGLSIGLKNDIEQIPNLVSYFDWQLNEECFSFQECDLLLPFIQAGKPVFQIEYELSTTEFCEQAKQFGFQSIRKNWQLDEYSETCS
ncbi:MAG: hypothetical protein UZ14_CFX002001141 [Chloroflexi bacterium OLB14]|nr:MAG: hypothetical protein UZ14_CFX002001141 [Chloroflexi bacterium OLB14]